LEHLLQPGLERMLQSTPLTFKYILANLRVKSIESVERRGTGSCNLRRADREMVKKSKKTAARYSELSKAKRKKQRDTAPSQVQQVSVGAAREQAEPEPVAKAASRPASRAQSELKRGTPSYQYVRADLKKIGMLAGAMLVILIILSFVLG